MKIIYSEFDFNRVNKYQLIKKLCFDKDYIFWRVSAKKDSYDYFNSLKNNANFPDSHILEIKDEYIDFKYNLNLDEYKRGQQVDFKEFILRNFETKVVSNYDFSKCNYLSDIKLKGETLMVFNTYLSLAPSQVFRVDSRVYIKSIFEFPCNAIPYYLLESETLNNKIYNLNYFDKYKKEFKLVELR